MPDLDNAAKRLHHWLRQATEPAELARRYQQGHRHDNPPPSNVIDVWGGIWDLDPRKPDARIRIQERGLGLIREARQTRILVEGSPHSFAVHGLKHFGQIEKAVAHLGHMETAQITAMMAPIDHAGWSSLEILSSILGDLNREPTLHYSEQTTLLEKVQALVNEVMSERELSSTTKRQIIDHLREVERALVDATIEGASTVERASNGLLGMVMRLRSQDRNIVSSPVARGLLALVVSIELALNGAANIATLTAEPAILQIVGDPSDLLPELPPASEDPVGTTADPDASGPQSVAE